MEHNELALNGSELLYMQIPAADRVYYENANNSLSYESYLEEIKIKSRNFISIANSLLEAVDTQTSKTLYGRLKLCTYLAEKFYKYAVDGDPYFVYTYKNHNRCEIDESDHVEFSMDLSAFLAYNELFTCLEESMGAGQPAFSMKVVLNMFFARLKLDAARYSGSGVFFSIAEIALLARMKEKSVRNFAHKSMDAQYSPSRRMTLISAKNAIEWLASRRKFIPSVSLETEHARRVLISIHDEFGKT